ncbi:hypothetical protein P872_10655 [Rhodonellum psychrophilum GCM71 = DSM 17998]|uniref:DUF3024 domain-containing protein n=2 Tax=Rhodonellum TaxID=336827 RepID=U5BLJ5_9BACT|nr:MULTISPECIES: DUF3024 domain-containing protein [Rhodonellum]ERM81335.1 hypothetical protein P872_10655 [Rhodonellum psychrophilum GCM71 = DSM 17998]SDY62301.1 Protein of unknown function [Rhodonellum ikkaensis]
MEFNPFHLREIQSILNPWLEEKRPPVELREEMDLQCTIKDQNIVLEEISPSFRSPTIKLTIPLAKITFVNAKNEWKIYWMRASGKWELYKPDKKISTLEEILKEISDDPYGCFFG